MAEAKTKPTRQSVDSFIMKIPDPQTREDCFTVARLMKEATRSMQIYWQAVRIGKRQSGNIYSFELVFEGTPKGEETSKPKLIYRDKDQANYGSTK